MYEMKPHCAVFSSVNKLDNKRNDKKSILLATSAISDDI